MQALPLPIGCKLVCYACLCKSRHASEPIKSSVCCFDQVTSQTSTLLPAGSYKIPTASDIPMDLRVTLLDPSIGRGEYQPPNLVHSSKNTGEPPLFLGAAVFFALKQACYAARSEHGLTNFFQLDSPLSPERLRMACGDELVARSRLNPHAPVCC